MKFSTSETLPNLHENNILKAVFYYYFFFIIIIINQGIENSRNWRKLHVQEHQMVVRKNFLKSVSTDFDWFLL